MPRRPRVAAFMEAEDGEMRSVTVGSLVRLARPRALRGVIGTVRREVVGGYEVEFRTALGTPMHVVAPARHLRPMNPR